MRVVDTVEVVLRGEAYDFENNLGKPELISGSDKRVYLFHRTHPILEELRSGQFFSQNPSAYIALAYQTTRGDEPTAVVGPEGKQLKAYLKGVQVGQGTSLRWVHKGLYLVDDCRAGMSVTGWKLNLAVQGCIERVLVLEHKYTEGLDFLNKLLGGFS